MQRKRVPSRRLLLSVRRGVATRAIGAVAILVLLAIPLTWSASATGSGSFNYERVYFNSNHGEVYIERAPRLIWNPSAPGDSLEPNGLDWYTNLYSYDCFLFRCVPSAVQLIVYIRDLTGCGYRCTGPDYWYLNKFWPISSAEFGTTIQWTFSITGGNENLQGGISATVLGTDVNSIGTDYSITYWGNRYYRIGLLTIDLAENPGWNQVMIQGGFRLAIYNRDGPKVDNHRFDIWTRWDAAWKNCGSLSCYFGSDTWYRTDIVVGDNVGLGDGYIYVRQGDSNGS